MTRPTASPATLPPDRPAGRYQVTVTFKVRTNRTPEQLRHIWSNVARSFVARTAGAMTDLDVTVVAEQDPGQVGQEAP